MRSGERLAVAAIRLDPPRAGFRNPRGTDDHAVFAVAGQIPLEAEPARASLVHEVQPTVGCSQRPHQLAHRLEVAGDAAVVAHLGLPSRLGHRHVDRFLVDIQPHEHATFRHAPPPLCVALPDTFAGSGKSTSTTRDGSLARQPYCLGRSKIIQNGGDRVPVRQVDQYPVRQNLMAAGVLAAAAFLGLHFPSRDDTAGAMVGAALAFLGSAIGFAAVARVRPLPKRPLRERARFMGLSLMIGMALGLVNVIANYTVASLDSRIDVRMSEMYARASAWEGVFANPLLEEIGFRLCLMGGIAWLLSRSIDDRRRIVLVALAVSALVFGPLHLLRPPAGLLDGAVVALKAGVAGLLLGWVFWRWGLPYSIVCHGTTNATHLLTVSLFF